MSKRAATDETETETNIIKKAKVAYIKNPLPCEIGNMIFEHFDLHDLVVLTENVLTKAYNPDIHTHEYAIRNNDLPMLKWLFKNQEVEPSDGLIDFTAECGNLEIFKYVKDTLDNWNLSTCLSLECIEKIIQIGPVEGGKQFDILRHSITSRDKIDERRRSIDYQYICITAVKYNRRNIVEWMILRYLQYLDIFEILKEALNSRHCTIIQWILDNCKKSIYGIRIK